MTTKTPGQVLYRLIGMEKLAPWADEPPSQWQFYDLVARKLIAEVGANQIATKLPEPPAQEKLMEVRMGGLTVLMSEKHRGFIEALQDIARRHGITETKE